MMSANPMNWRMLQRKEKGKTHKTVSALEFGEIILRETGNGTPRDGALFFVRWLCGGLLWVCETDDGPCGQIASLGAATRFVSAK
jgi:hypothetical protein